MRNALAALLLPTVFAAQAAPPALRLDVTDRARLLVQPRPWAPETQAPADAAHPPAKAALALEFASPPRTTGPRSLFRVQLSADSALNFRPRGGGLQVTYKSTF